VCEIRNENQLVPRHILMTGSGDETFKGFKSEWATLKGDQMIVGSHGKTAKEEWIKILSRNYSLESMDWHSNYQRIRDALNVGDQGYVTHEAAEWHPYSNCWLFFPRKISGTPFEEAVDEKERGGNTLVFANPDFTDIKTIEIGQRTPERGVSSFKLIPGRTDECIGLKSVEIGDRTETYLFCFDLEGNLLQDDTLIGRYKCEGVEIL
jgi:soluble calcium-activated nucleotidase 1